jgi:recombination protein RecR
MAIEHTGQYRGIYHVLGGVISPMDGIGPGDLNVARLEEKAAQNELSEVILALRGDMEGDTTSFYLYKRLKDYPCRLTTLARGIAVGDQLEYTDEVTLGQSIARRVPYEG